MLHILADVLFQNNGSQANTNKKDFIKSASDKSLELPEGCFINYDPVAIDFMQQLTATRIDSQVELYESLKASFGYKPSMGAFYHAGGSIDTKQSKTWHTYWLNNPVNAWTGGSRAQGGKRAADKAYFKIEEEKLTYLTAIAPEELDAFNVMVQELVNYRFLQYEQRLTNKVIEGESSPVNGLPDAANSIPYFSDLKIACGHFRTSSHETDEIEQIALPEKYGTLDPAKHFIARAMGNSMNGGKHPIHDGDYLLLEHITSNNAGSISNQIVAIERQDTSGDDQYLLRSVNKLGQGQYELIAQNSDYEPMMATEDMATFARLKDVIDPLDLYLHQSFMREEVPGLFGLEFNTGSWQSGHVCVKDHSDQYLFATLVKRGRNAEHRYHDYFEDAGTFHWQSQNSGVPTSGKGKRVVEHQKTGSKLHLFVRKDRLIAKKGAPFYYCGTVNYVSHEGEKPMSVVTELDSELSEYLKLEFME